MAFVGGNCQGVFSLEKTHPNRNIVTIGFLGAFSLAGPTGW